MSPTRSSRRRRKPVPAPALSNRAVARSLTDQPAPPGRGLRPDAAIARLASPRRAIARTATKIESYGTFSIDNYDPVDTDKDNDTTKSCGINIDVTYTPPPHIKSNKIGFVQMMKCLKGDGTPLLFENEKPRATDAKSGDEGWAVDRLKDMKQGYYGMEDSGAAGGNLKLGSRTDKDNAVDAFMHDRISLRRQAGKTAGCTAMTFAIDIEHGKYLGGFCWGYSVDASGKVTGNALVAGDMGDVQRAAIKAWNEQAKNKDAAKRNAPDQQLLPEDRPLGDFNIDPNIKTMRVMAAADELERTLDSVDPFWDEDAGPIFPSEAMRLLEGVPDVEQALLRVATDEQQPLARRFAAVEASSRAVGRAGAQRPGGRGGRARDGRRDPRRRHPQPLGAARSLRQPQRQRSALDPGRRRGGADAAARRRQAADHPRRGDRDGGPQRGLPGRRPRRATCWPSALDNRLLV